MTFDEWFNQNCKGMSAEAYRVMQMAWNARAERMQGSGVTVANWKEHDGKGVPEEVKKAGNAAVIRSGYHKENWGEASSNDGGWRANRSGFDITHYTIIEP